MTVGWMATRTLRTTQAQHATRSARLGRTRLGGAAVGLALLWAPTLGAAKAPTNGVIADPERPDPGLVVTPTMEFSYDDNVFRTDNAIVASADSFILSPGAIIAYSRSTGRADLTVSAEGDYDFYTGVSGRDQLRLKLDGDADIRFGGTCRANPAAQFRRARASYGDVNTAIDNQQEFSTLSLTIACPKEAGLFPLAQIRRETTKNDADFDFADQKKLTYLAGAAYAAPSLGSFILYYAHEDSDRPALDLKNRVDQIGLAFRRSVVSHFAADIDVQWLKVNPTRATVQEYSGPGWDATLTYKPVPSLVFKARTARQIVNDSLVPSGYTIASTYQSNLDWAILSRTYLTARYVYDRRRFRPDPTVPSLIGSDKVNIIGVGARREVGERISLVLDYTHVKRRTDTKLSEYTANVAMLSAKAAF
jgi:hypothetical protein